MKLYIYEHCPFCTRVRLALGMKNIPYETVVVMEGDAETPIRLIGKKAVPILERPDGIHMGESLDIVHFIDKLEKPIFDDPANDALDAWGTDAWRLGVKLFIPRFTRAQFAELATPQAREAYRLREEKAFGNLDDLLADSPAYVTEMNIKLKVLGGLLDGRELGGISDIKLWPILRSLSIVRGLEFPPVVLRYMETIEKAGGVGLLFDQAI
jgi:glutaredoxin 2